MTIAEAIIIVGVLNAVTYAAVALFGSVVLFKWQQRWLREERRKYDPWTSQPIGQNVSKP